MPPRTVAPGEEPDLSAFDPGPARSSLSGAPPTWQDVGTQPVSTGMVEQEW